MIENEKRGQNFLLWCGFLERELVQDKKNIRVRPAHQYQNSSQYKILLVFTIFFSSFGLKENEPTKLRKFS